MITTTTVTSKDGVKFSVSFYSRTEAQIAAAGEVRFAATRLAHELDSFGDYHRVGANGFVEAPTPKLPPKLSLIQGGRA
jgi:hypothetical protein